MSARSKREKSKAKNVPHAPVFGGDDLDSFSLSKSVSDDDDDGSDTKADMFPAAKPQGVFSTSPLFSLCSLS
jgi:hypothetical protein